MPAFHLRRVVGEALDIPHDQQQISNQQINNRVFCNVERLEVNMYLY